MKVLDKETFEPIKLTVVFETQDELDFLGSLLNTRIVAEAGRSMGAVVSPLAEAISKAGGNIHLTSHMMELLRKRK